MKNKLTKLIFFLLLASTASVFAQQNPKKTLDSATTKQIDLKTNFKQIIGNYYCWSWYGDDKTGARRNLTVPKNIDFNKYTIINYCYWTFDENGFVIGKDEYADSILLRGEKDYVNPIQPAYVPATSLIDLAHSAGVKVLVSIGGWMDSPKFPAMAADPVKRANFAHSCVKAVHNYGFNGVDIAWLHPGMKSQGGSEADKDNFAILMKQVRDSLDHYEKVMEENILLTAVFAPEDALTQHIDWEAAVTNLSYINFMNWDMNMKGSDVISHVAPLYSPTKGDTNSVANAFKTFRNKYRIPAKKLILGISFTGTSIIGKPEGVKIDLFSTEHLRENDTVTFSNEQIPYWDIVRNKKQFDEKWDDVAKASYMIGKTLNTFVSYDDPKSIRLKSQFILDKEVRGIIINDITSDMFENGEGSGTIDKTPLTDIVNETFQMKRKKPIEKRWKDYAKAAAAPVEKPKDWRSSAVKSKFKGIYKKPVSK